MRKRIRREVECHNTASGTFVRSPTGNAQNYWFSSYGQSSVPALDLFAVLVGSPFAIGSHSGDVADSGAASEKLYLIRGAPSRSRPVAASTAAATTGDYDDMQNGDHEPR